MQSETAQPTSEIPTTPRPKAWPDRWTFQYFYWCETLSSWRCINAAIEYDTEMAAIKAAQGHELQYGGPVRIVRIPGEEVKHGE
jgi:hypothetical protein